MNNEIDLGTKELKSSTKEASNMNRKSKGTDVQLEVERRNNGRERREKRGRERRRKEGKDARGQRQKTNTGQRRSAREGNIRKTKN